MREIDFNAEFANYLSLRESLGIPIYQISPVLQNFVKYLNEHSQGPVVRAHSVLDWVCSGNYSTATQHARLSAARVFLKHLKAIVPETELPGFNLLARHHRAEPFVFSTGQLAQLLDFAGKLDSRKSLAALTVKTMFGLMACTGLRPGEAMRLKSSQVFLDEMPPRLLVFRTKFYKTRWVPLHATTVAHLRTYLQMRGQQSITPDDFFFVSKVGKPVNRITCDRIFQQLIRQAGIGSRSGQMRPTPHSLRHTFAVNRLQQWYESGDDFRELIPNLSVYLGHIDPASSFWYLTCTPELMAAAAQRFELHSGGGISNEERR